jgi:gluconolactonase
MRAAWALLACSALAAAQDFSKVQVESLASGFQFLEGPAWSARESLLYFSDIPKNQTYRFNPVVIDPRRPNLPAVFRADSGGACGNAFDAKGNLYTCESHNRRVTRTDIKGKVEVLADQWQGKKLNAPNDIVVRHDGHVYFTDPAFGSQADKRELDFYGVYHITPKGELNVIAKPTGRPNGITLTADGKTLYVSDSDNHRILAYTLDHNGEASDERVAISGIDGVPDGVRTDSNGNLYVAASNLLVFDSAGKPLAKFQFSHKPSNCAFGGAGLDTLFVTAHGGLYRLQVNVKGSGY